MSAAVERESEMMSCASCGIAGVDDVKLKDCDDCDLVKYCSDACQELHRPQHEEECKKRAAELRDEILFKQPESNHLGDCPICSLPIPVDPSKYTCNICCGKILCQGCNAAIKKRVILEESLQEKCPFCRKALPTTDEEKLERAMKRIEANDPIAMRYMATRRYEEGDYTAAIEYFSRAAELGEVDAHYNLSILYREGKGVEKDKKKELHHLTEAAIGGHPIARHKLGVVEVESGCGSMDRLVKHLIIAAKLGDDTSLKCAKELYKDGHVSKEDFAVALRGHHATAPSL